MVTDSAPAIIGVKFPIVQGVFLFEMFIWMYLPDSVIIQKKPFQLNS